MRYPCSVSRSGFRLMVCTCGTNQGTRIKRFAPTLRVCGTVPGRSARTLNISRSGSGFRIYTCGTNQGTRFERFAPTLWQQIVLQIFLFAYQGAVPVCGTAPARSARTPSVSRSGLKQMICITCTNHHFVPVVKIRGLEYNHLLPL